MNKIEAKELLHSLHQRLDRKKPLKEQIAKLFVPTLWGDSICQVETLHGRVARILQKSKPRATQEKNVLRIFARAVKTIQQDRSAARDLPLSFLVDLDRCLHSENLLDHEGDIKVSQAPAQEIHKLEESVKKAQEAHVDKEKEQAKLIRQLSLLRSNLSENYPNINLDQFNALFDENLDTAQAINILHDYLKKCPEHAHPRLKEYIKLIEEGAKFRQELQTQFFPQSKPLTQEIRHKQLHEVAQKMEARVKALEQDKPWIYCGSYGGNKTPINNLACLLSKLPAESLSALPTPVLEAIQSGNLPDPNALISEGISTALKEALKLMPQAEAFLNNAFVSTLLPDASREITGKIATAMPKVIREGIESWMKQGLVGNVLEFIPDGEARDFILWVAERGAKIKADPKEKEQLLKEIEEKAKAFIGKPIKQATHSFESGLSKAIAYIPQSIPEPIMQMLGFDELFSSGQFWLEFCKQKNGKFTVQVYSTGKALGFHPKDPQGNVKWPLVLTDVSSDKLSTDFFHRLLFHHIEPNSNKESTARAIDLYEGLLNSLQGTPGPAQPNQWRNIPIQDTSEKALIQLLLTSPSLPKGQTSHEMHLEALLAFCAPLLKGPEKTLTIEQADICSALENAISVISEEAQVLAAKIEEPIKKRVEATIAEVKIAIAKYRTVQTARSIELPGKGIKLPTTLLTMINGVLTSSGINADSLKSAKSTLCWALGDEFGDLIDALISTMNNAIPAAQPSQQSPPPAIRTPAAPQGWLRTIIFNAYFGLVIKGLQIAMLFSKFYAIGVGTLIEPAIRYGLSKVIPVYIQEWYSEFVKEAERKLAEFTLQIILRCFFSKQESALLQGAIHNVRSTIKTWSSSLLGNQTIGFTLDSHSTLPPTTPLFTLQPTKNLCDDLILGDLCETIDAESLFLKNAQSNSDQTIPKEKIETTLSKWLEIVKDNNHNPYTLVPFLVKNLQKLEVPIPGKDGIWDQVSYPEKCLELLSDLNIVLLNNFDASQKSEFGQLMVVSYAVLAIMDRLAKRCPVAHLKGYTIDAYPLFNWLKQTNGTQIDNPTTLEQLEKVCQYFIPGCDLNNLPTNKELAALSKKALFDYSFLDSWSDPYFSSSKSTLEKPEFRYLENRFNQPSVRQKMESLGLNPDKLNVLDKYAFLLEESSVFTRGAQSILPRPYTLLRLQTLLCKELCHARISFKIHTPFRRNTINKIKTAPPPVVEIDHRSTFQMLREGDIAKGLQSATRGLIKRTSLTISGSLSAVYSTIPKQEPARPLTQSEAMVKTYHPKRDIKNQLQMLIECEPSNQVLRALAHYRQFPGSLNHVDYFPDINEQVYGIDFLQQTLFHPGKLSKLLKETPKNATAIGESIAAMMDYLADNDFTSYNQITRIGLKLKKFCLHYAPEHCHTFPDFQKHIKTTMEKNKSNTVEGLILSALTFGNPSSALTDQEQQEAVLALCKALFQLNATGIQLWFYNPIYNCNDYNIHLKTLIEEFRVNYSEWLPVLVKQLENPVFHSKFINELQRELNIVLPQNRQLSIKNLLSGIITGPGVTFPNHIKQIKNICIARFNSPEQLLFDGKGRIFSPDGSFELVMQNGIYSSYTCKKRIDQKMFRFLPSSSLVALPLLDKVLDGLPKNEINCWLEDNDQSDKELIIIHDGKVLKRLSVKKDPNSDTYSLQSKLHDGLQLQYSVGSALPNQLAPLSRFCPLESINCWILNLQKLIKTIDIPGYKLSFNVENQNGEHRAYCNSTPGFFIKPVQSHVALDNFSTFLLLSNRAGENKVLIPGGKWISTASWKYVASLGPLANKLSNFIDQNIKLNQSEGKYYTYNIDPASNQLTSDDPEALGYLVSLYILQGNMEKAMQTCSELELLSKRQAIPEDIIKVLYPLFIPTGIEGIVPLRHRLLAAIEENRLLQVKPQEKQTSSSKKDEEKTKSFPTNSFFIATLLIHDLTQPSENIDPRHKLNDYQEWYLFKKLISCLEELIDYGSTPAIQQVIDRMGKSNLIVCNLPASIQTRYAALKQRLGKKESLVLHTIRIANNVLQAKSSISNIPVVSLAPTIYSVETLGKDVATAFKQLGTYYSVDLKSVNPELMATLNTMLCVDPPLTLELITPEIFKREFLTYYSIARNKNSKEQHEKLGKLLPLIKGGWDKQSRLLVGYLEAVYKAPIIFWKVKNLQKGSITSKESPTIAFFNHLHNRYVQYHSISQGSKIIGNVAINQLVVSKGNFFNPVYNAIPMPWLTLPAADLASRAYNAYATSSPVEMIKPALPNTPLMTQSYAPLEIEDQQMDALCNSLFDIAFEKVVPAHLRNKSVAISPFQIASQEPAENAGIARVNASINDFYARPDVEHGFLKIKSQDRLWDLYLNLTACRDKIKSDLETRRARIVSLVNADKLKAINAKPITFEELQKWFLKEDHRSLTEISGLPPQALQHLDLAVAQDTVRFTRLQQIERAIRHLEELSQLDPNTQQHDYEQKIEQLADELRARRAYSFSTLAPRLLRRFMTFELSTDKMLWKKQAECLQGLLLGKHDHAVIELLMSFGKTYFGIPTIDSFEADGKKVVFNIWPSGMFGTNVRQISKQSKHVYDQTVNTLHFNRNLARKTENYDAILMLLKKAKEHGETINMTKEDAQASELLFLDFLYSGAKGKKTNNFDESHLLHLAGILRTMRKSGKAVGDEAHELFNDKQELNYPIGERAIVPLNYYQVIEACMRHVAAHPKLRTLIDINDSQGIQAILASEVVPYLAEKMSHYWKFKITDAAKRNEFISFVSGKSNEIPAWIQNSPLCSEISLVKGMLTVLLPLVWKRSVNVDYGPSRKNNGEYARPYEGNTSPMEQSSIQEPYEATIKTAIMFLHRKLSPSQCGRAIFILKLKMEAEMKSRQVPAIETSAYKLFKKHAPEGVDLLNYKQLSQLQLKKLFEMLRKQEDFIFFYMHQCVWKEIQYHPLNLRSDAHNFGSMFHTQFHDTGTPYNDGTYPDHLKMLWDPGTTGEALHILSKKCPENGIHILNKSRPQEVLDEVLNTYFKAGTDFSALIDGGAQLHGLDNLSVAKQMLSYVKQHRPDIRAIDFFMQDAEGRDQLVSWEIGADQPIPYDQCNLPTKSRLAYFDQRHGFAANIPQKFNGKGLNLIGSTHTLYRLLQEVFRMRGIKVFKRLIKGEMTPKELDELNLSQAQSIHFAMTPEVRQLISGNQTPTLRDIITFAIKNESKMVAEHNYHSFRKKVNNVIRRAMLDKILEAQTPKEMIALFKRCEHVLVSRCEEDPKKLYGLIDGFIQTEQALEACKKSALNAMKKSGIFSQQEESAIENQLKALQKPPMPKEVHVYKDNTRLHTNLLDNLGREVSQEQENDQEQELECDLYTSAQSKKMAPFKEWEWSEDFNPLALDWQRFQLCSETSSSTLMSAIYKTSNLFSGLRGKKKDSFPPLFRVTDLLKSATNRSLQKVSKAFDERIWMSNNFLPRNVRNFMEAPAAIGSHEQRELFEVLVHSEEDEKGMKFQSIGCLSQHDASVWRKKLVNIDAQTKGIYKNTRVFLYDTMLRSVTAGSNVSVSNLRQNKEFSKLLSQLRFINGSENHHQDHIPELQAWIKESGAEQMQDAFNTIHSQRGKHPMSGTDIEQIFAKCNRTPAEEII